MTTLDEIKNLVWKEYQETAEERDRLVTLVSFNHDLTELDLRAEKQRLNIAGKKLNILLHILTLLYDLLPELE